jgi:hypothetical protein
MQFMGSQPNLDVAVFKGPEGPAFRLAVADVQVGRAVQLLSYPLAFDRELQLPVDSQPAMDTGIVSQMSETGWHGIATFGTGRQVEGVRGWARQGQTTARFDAAHLRHVTLAVSTSPAKRTMPPDCLAHLHGALLVQSCPTAPVALS